MATGQTKLTNLINPQVMADMIAAELPKKIKMAPFAVIDNTLQGVAGNTITIPKFAYVGEAEVERRNEAENEANRVHYLFVPLASYKPTTQTWGAGLALGVETKNLVLQLQALKPITAGFDSFKDWDDVTILLGAGLRF